MRCTRCKTEVDSNTYICDSCRLSMIRKRIEEKTSYVNHISDLTFLMEQHDKLFRMLTSHGPEGHQYTNAAYVHLMQDRHSFKLKYEICKEALEYYAEKTCIQQDDIGVDIGYIARKRLKESAKL